MSDGLNRSIQTKKVTELLRTQKENRAVVENQKRGERTAEIGIIGVQERQSSSKYLSLIN